ncbi:hypothetical protein C0J52_27082 [Blattella germanica]|nr:hypothetical protein C0J52_27082 [Blattella germanica]
MDLGGEFKLHRFYGRVAGRKRRKVSGGGGTYSGVSVSQLLAQRERGLAAGTPPQGKESAVRAPQGWNGGPPPSGTNSQLPSVVGPQMHNRPQFPPPNFSSDVGVVQGVNASPQFLRYSTPNGGVAPAILGGNIMVHPNGSPVPLNNLTQHQQHLMGQQIMNLQPGNQQHNPVMDHSSLQNNNPVGNPHQCGIVTAGNTALLPGNANNAGVMSNNSMNQIMPGSANGQVVMNAGMMIHSAGNPGIIVPPLHHHTPPPPVWTEEVTRKKKGSGKSNSSARKQRPYNIHEHHQHHRVGMAGMPGNGGSTQIDSHAPCPNIDVRQIPIEHNRPPPTHPNNSDSSNPGFVAGNNPNIPSFMEDPSGYLAQQTALLNSTISRQTGVGGPNFMCHSPVRNPITPDQQAPSPQNVAVNLPTSCSSPATVGVPLPSNVLIPAPKGTPNFTSRTNTNIPVQQPGLNVHASIANPVTITSHHNIGSPAPATSVAVSYSQPQNQAPTMLSIGMPDSSALPEQRMEMGSHCQGCVVTSGSLLPVSSSGGENMLFHHPMQHQIQSIMQAEHAGAQRVHAQQHGTLQADFKHYHGQQNTTAPPNDTIVQQQNSSGTPTPHVIQEENPVTSSTFDRLGNPLSRHQIPMVSDSRGPIQGGTVSTSNGSPVETYTLPQPEASPTSSTPTSSQNCRIPDTSSSSNNVYISSASSSSSPFTVPNVSPPGGLYSYPNSVQTHFQVSRSENNVACSSPGVTNNTSAIRQHSGRPGDYCHHIHDQRGQKFAVQSTTMVTTMASGHTVSSNTITSVLAGKANTATVSVGNPAAPTSNTPPSSLIPLATQPAPPIYTSQTAMMSMSQVSQGMQVTTVSKSPLEMVQSVVSSIQVPQQQQSIMGAGNSMQNSPQQQQPQPPQQQHQQQATAILKSSGAPGLPPGHILVSSGGQLIMANPGNVMTPPGTAGLMAPPPQPPPPHSMAKLVSHSSMPPMSVSPMVTSVTAAVTQVIPAVGVAQQVLGQPTVLVNALPAPLLIQPGVMTMDGMTGLNQNTMQIPHLAVATGNVIHHSQGPSSAGNGIGQILDSMNQEHAGSRNTQSASNYVRHTTQQPSLLSPPEMSHATPTSGSGKKKGSKKRKVSPQTVASMLHIASQQNSPAAAATATATGIVMQQQQQQNFPQQSFTMSGPHQSIATTGPMLQALTIVPGKAGAPAQILMNGQPGTAAGHFGTQQLIAAPTTSQPPQQINLLQPVNLLNGATGVVQNFPTFQQFIVPSLGGMVMATDGTTTLLPDATNLGVQLQLQNVNGQNVLTPVQSHGGTTVFGHPTGQSILAAGPAGMVIRTPTTGNKMTTGPMLQQQNGGGPQFLASSPNGGQFLMNGTATFGGQLSPLVANVSPNQQMSFTTNTSPVRHNTGTHQPQQEFIQCGQMGQTLMVPCTASATQNHQNTTVVQQNTTIVQQQTTMVSNNQQLVTTPQNFPVSNTNTVASATTLNVNQQNFIVGSSTTQCMQDKMQPSPIQQTNSASSSPPPSSRQTGQQTLMMKHSVSTQTAVNQSVQASSSPTITPGSLVVTTNNTFCQTSTAASSGGSPPDTTTHSPVDPGGGSSSSSSGSSSDGRPQTPSADTTTHSTGVGSTDDGLSSPSPSSCPVSGSCSVVSANGENLQGRQQTAGVNASPMPMVHCVSSSNEQDTSVIGEQAEYEWGVSSGKGIFVSPTVTEGGFGSNASSPRQTYIGSDVLMSVTGVGHMICENERRKSVGNVYVESSTIAGLPAFAGSGSELAKQQEAVVSSRQMFEYAGGEERRVVPRNPKLCSSSNVALVGERAAKRKHSDALVVMETHPHDIRSMEEDDEGRFS